MLVTTHHLDEAGFCDRLVVMAAGRVVAQGTLAGIVGERTAVAVEARPGRPPSRLSTRAASPRPSSAARCAYPAAMPPTCRLRSTRGGVAAALSIVPATFEETFVALVPATIGRTAP